MCTEAKTMTLVNNTSANSSYIAQLQTIPFISEIRESDLLVVLAIFIREYVVINVSR